MLLGSKTHTVGDTRRWTVDYDEWLDNTALVRACVVTSSSTTCTIGTGVLAPVLLGRHIQFWLIGGALNEQPTVTVIMTDNLGNIKNDTIAFTVITP